MIQSSLGSLHSLPHLKDPSTVEQELSKSYEIECTMKNDSGVNDHSDISSHDDDMIAYETKESSSPSIEISSSDAVASQTEDKAVSSESETEPESAIQVEVVEPRRSGRNRKQTKLFGNPLLYKIAPRFIPEILQQMSETLESLQEKYSGNSGILRFCTFVFICYILWKYKCVDTFSLLRGRKVCFVNLL